MFALLVQTEIFKHLIHREKELWIAKDLNNERFEELFESFQVYKNIYLTLPVSGVAAFVKERESGKCIVLKNVDTKMGEREFLNWIEQMSQQLV